MKKKMGGENQNLTLSSEDLLEKVRNEVKQSVRASLEELHLNSIKIDSIEIQSKDSLKDIEKVIDSLLRKYKDFLLGIRDFKIKTHQQTG